MDVTLHQLRCFLAVSASLHFARAAEALRIGPSTLSEQIATLERVLGRRLFERGPRAVSVTPEGEELLPLAREAVAAADAVLAWGRGPQRAALVVGTAGSSHGLRAILQAAAERLPEVSLRLQPVGFTGGLRAVRRGEVDCAFAVGLSAEAPPEGLRSWELWSEPLLVAVPDAHPLAARASIAVEELWGETLIGAAPSEPRAEDARDPWYAGIDPSLTERCRILPLVSSADETMELVAAGTGLNIAGSAARESYHRPGIRFVPLESPLEVRSLLVLRDERPSAALAAFVALARDVAADGPRAAG
ncbi:LysR family transcriptional regulator [Leucobacter allii]|uniref:LysR family transcriptional regulator n=1 Tax=Leucobacter allii TaxID=2932247 RepID=A0ABY4FMB5_9MICO|nr:LysR family transcriptional regulator [Leucobacter allii]UOQ57422.1 LysR family transcriptional regulator [Leucobacter allii]